MIKELTQDFFLQEYAIEVTDLKKLESGKNINAKNIGQAGQAAQAVNFYRSGKDFFVGGNYGTFKVLYNDTMNLSVDVLEAIEQIKTKNGLNGHGFNYAIEFIVGNYYDAARRVEVTQRENDSLDKKYTELQSACAQHSNAIAIIQRHSIRY